MGELGHPNMLVMTARICWNSVGAHNRGYSCNLGACSCVCACVCRRHEGSRPIYRQMEAAGHAALLLIAILP